MKVKGVSQNPAPMIIFVLIFGAISSLIYYGFWKIYLAEGILGAIVRAGVPMLFALFFTGVIFKFFFLLCKPPVWIKAKLKEISFNGEYEDGFYYLKFNSDKVNLPLFCWTLEEYDFQKNKEYNILVKEFTNRIYRIEELDSTY